MRVVQIAGPWAIEGEVSLMWYSFSRGQYNILGGEEFSSKCTSDKLKNLREKSVCSNVQNFSISQFFCYAIAVG